MPAPALIHELVERFDRNRDVYRSGQYNETQARREFIDPFFEALGWDVHNRQGYAEAYKDVIHEDAIKIGGATKAPDYCFRIGGTRKFFVEAKKPSVKLRDDISAAFQLRRYAWSAKLPLSLLTDFDEFAIYDCRGKPDKSDKPSSGRVLMLDYGDYLARWDEIAGVFSREAILRGSFDKYAESVTGKHGTAAVDDAFLREIEGWRETLARTIALRNPALSQRALNTAVQATIDRIVFLRICEDRGIEGYGTLLALTNGSDVYARLADLFRQADARYNSGLFHFATEGDRPESPDAWTLGLAIDDKPLREILRGLYYPDSPYEFAVLPADILGQVYEQFLGQVIRLTAGHRAVVEAKPEVKKAGGVFYTPTFIVRVIVRRTVGPLLAGKTVREVAGRGGVTPLLRIADIACGSGTFLLEVYQFLLDWYLAQYVAHLAPLLQAGHTVTSSEVRAQLPEDAAPAPKRPRKTDGSLPIYEAAGGYATAGGEWRLTTAERKRILTTHIYGVDIDPQAVETTKLSLLLKVLEGENEQTLGSQLRLFQERALPDLARNIKCGNSLIGPEFYDGQQLGLLEDEERYRINAFDWAAEFPEVFADGNGFDAIVGNPPYVHARGHFDDAFKEFIARHYIAAEYQINTFGLFIEKAMCLLKSHGELGFIVPNYWLSTKYDLELRRLLFRQFSTRELINVFQVFNTASVDCLLLFVGKTPPESNEIMVRSITADASNVAARLLALKNEEFQTSRSVPISSLSSDLKISFGELFDVLRKSRLGDFCDVFFGMKPYQVGKGKPKQTKVVVEEKKFNAGSRLDESYYPLIAARHIKRYQPIAINEWIWYGEHLAEPRKLSLFQDARLVLQRILSSRNIPVTYTTETLVCNTDVMTIKFKKGMEIHCDLRFIQGILGSRFIGWYLKSRNVNLNRDTFPKVNTNDLSSLPVPILPTESLCPTDVARHDRMVALVEAMLDLHRKLAAAVTDQEKAVYQRQIVATDRLIDRLVYELYGLTAEEIGIVEAGG